MSLLYYKEIISLLYSLLCCIEKKLYLYYCKSFIKQRFRAIPSTFLILLINQLIRHTEKFARTYEYLNVRKDEW